MKSRLPITAADDRALLNQMADYKAMTIRQSPTEAEQDWFKRAWKVMRTKYGWSWQELGRELDTVA